MRTKAWWREYNQIHAIRRQDTTRLRRDKRKQEAIAYKGGQCLCCGYDKCSAALTFHHRISAEKEFEVGLRLMSHPWEQILLELDKCDMLCANCHAEEHYIVHTTRYRK